jgi:hypothetical protein
MITARVTFYGATKNNFGMPDPYHSYFVVSTPWQTAGSGIASVVSLSSGAPLTRQHFPMQQGGERAAFDEAITALAAEAGNHGLAKIIHES